MRKALMLSLICSPLAFVSTAEAGSYGKSCTSFTREKWAPLSAIERKLTVEGYTVRSAKIRNDCVEVYALDSSGTRVELFVDPATGAVVGRQ
jgi:hypothetical protein